MSPGSEPDCVGPVARIVCKNCLRREAPFISSGEIKFLAYDTLGSPKEHQGRAHVCSAVIAAMAAGFRTSKNCSAQKVAVVDSQSRI